jgi:hypothetical protein
MRIEALRARKDYGGACIAYGGGTMSLKKRLVAVIASGGLFFGVFAAPAAAHNVTLEQMHIADFESGGINTQMWLSIEDHPGKVMITLKKKNASGDWVNVSTKEATYQPGWGYTKTFNPVAGNTKCKAKGVFTKKDHNTVKGTSDVISC